SALLKHHKANKSTYPVFVVISDSLSEAILGDELMEFKMTYPESNILYRATSSGALEQHSLWNPKAGALGELKTKVDLPSVRVFKKEGQTIAYLRNDQKDEVFCLVKAAPIAQELNEKSWANALAIQGNYQALVFHPHESHFRWLDLVKKSFRSQIMTPVTSYISLENEAQKQALKEKQKQILNAKRSLDAGDEMQQMSEPGFWILLLLLVMFLVFRQYQSTRRLIQKP
ncbi:MAG: MSEP-CTERM sorting domain-containing protein, partial [Bacteroidota bacterium]